MRIVVTRPKGRGQELARRLRELGHDVELCPLIEVEPTGPPEVDVAGYEWVIVTSPNGARELAERMRGRPRRLAAIGPGTAAALRAHGLEPDLVPAVSTQEGLLEELPRPAGYVLFAGAVGARTLLVEQLNADFIPLYRIRELQPESFPEADLVVLASPSAARITHGIPPQEVLQGALVLANTVPYMPGGIHLAVVDPGVGTSRRPLALRDESGRLYVGPDNGLLVPAADAMGGIAEAHEIANPAYALEEVSRTFHGRDLFSPAAAHLARGVALGDLGPPLAPDTLVRLDLPTPDISPERIRAIVLYVDRYGNVQLNLNTDHLEEVGIVPGTQVEIEIRGERYFAVAARTFADARPGDIILYEDAYENVALAISRGNVAEMFGARPGDRVQIRSDSL